MNGQYLRETAVAVGLMAAFAACVIAALRTCL
jgi:hypothetical protein